MDPCAPFHDIETRSPEAREFRHDSQHSIILLIGSDLPLQATRAAVLKSDGFHVRTAHPREAKGLIDGSVTYPLVVFGSAIDVEDIPELAAQIRLRSQGSKLLLILGPDVVPVDISIFDATLEGMDGPAALIREVRRLADSQGMI